MKFSLKLCWAVAWCAVAVSLYAAEPQNYHNSYWRMTVSGNTDLLLTLHIDGDHFCFSSRKGSTRDLLGARYFLARLTGKVRPTIVEISGKCHWANDTLKLEGNYISLTSKQVFNGQLVGRKAEAVLSNNRMTGQQLEEARPFADYPSVCRQAIDTTEKMLYNPALLQDKAWKKFKKQVLALSANVQDDYEFEKGYNIHVGKLPFSHYGLSLKAGDNQSATGSSKSKRKFSIAQPDAHTVLFTVSTFSASAAEIIPFIDTLKTLNKEHLIIDLRNNGGGSIASALPLAAYLCADTLYGGLFLTRRYFSNHTMLPKIADYRNFPLFSEASFQLIIEGIHKQEGLCLMVAPDQHCFKGKVIILTNRNTGSTCEPFVYGLKQSGRATVVGERTAGAMLNGERFQLTGKYKLWMPTADYYAADGTRLDKTGVTPDCVVAPEKAMEKAMELLKVTR